MYIYIYIKTVLYVNCKLLEAQIMPQSFLLKRRQLPLYYDVIHERMTLFHHGVQISTLETPVSGFLSLF